MLPFATVEEAETAMGRSLSAAESLWLNYSASKSDYSLYCHNIIFLFVIFSLFPVYYLFLEFCFKNSIDAFKIQPKVRLSFSDTLRCYKSVMRLFFLVVGPLQLVSYPCIKMVGIRTSLPLPSVWEIIVQLGVYFIVEDYTNYWIHRFLHCKWGYDKIHKVHHEYTAPIGFAAPYAHWAEILILGIPSFLGPAMVPGHIITFWLWIALRQIEAIETHSGFLPFNGSVTISAINVQQTQTIDQIILLKQNRKMPEETGKYIWKISSCHLYLGLKTSFCVFWYILKFWYDFPWSPTKYIPFYGGPDYHDYHHYVGGQSQSNFASVFTYCDYIYGTDKGYRYQKKLLQQLREGLGSSRDQKEVLHHSPSQLKKAY